MNTDSNHHIAAFYQAADQLLSTRHSAYLSIDKTNTGQYSFKVLPLSISWRILPFFGVDAHQQFTMENLKDLIGEKRLHRIFLRKELGLYPGLLDSKSSILTREVVHKIFIGLGDVRFEDLEEMAAKNHQSLKEMNVKKIDALYRELFPMQQIQDIFYRHCLAVDYHDKGKTSGKGFKGLQERVWTISKAKDEFIADKFDNPSLAKVSEIEMLTSRLGDREPPVGSVIRLPEGYFKVDRIFARKGAYVSVLSEIGCKQPRTLIICRGTAARWGATGNVLSGVNDCLKEIGLLGVRSIWHDLKRYLEEQKVSHVEVLGKSLGGAHAQYLAVLIAGKTSITLKSLSTCCSVGVPSRVQEIFNKTFSYLSSQQTSTFILRNTGDLQKNQVDYIPLVGGPHLHIGKVHVYYAAPQEDSIHSSFIPDQGIIKKLICLLKSFSNGHTRQNTLKPFKLYESRNIEQEVNKGRDLEPIRFMVARIFHLFTLGYFNSISFEDFYQKA